MPGQKAEVLRLMQLCDTVYNSVNVLSVTPMSKVQMLLKHPEFVKTAGYSAMEVLKTFDFKPETIEMLSPERSVSSTIRSFSSVVQRRRRAAPVMTSIL